MLLLIWFSRHTNGGILGEVSALSTTVYMDLPTYKSILKIIAKARYNNERKSISLIDAVCHAVAQEHPYTIEWVDSNKNILITFTTLRAYSVYIIGYILTALFDTMPSIIVVKE